MTTKTNPARTVSSRLLLGCASVLIGLASIPAGVLAAQQAGVAAGVIGNLRVSEGERTAAERIKSGMDMLLGDRVNSEKASRMQVLLLDETVFTIGPDSDLVIDEFVYDPAAGTGRLTANFTRGVMRYVSGKVALTNPAAVTIKTRDATIGVRGTALFVMDDPEAADGTQFIGLLGPGGRNDGGLKVGGLTVSTPQGSTDVFRAGFGTFVTPGQAPSPIVQTPARLTLALQSQLTAPVPASEAPAEGGGEGESDSGGGASEGEPAVGDAAEASGETVASTALDSREVSGVLADLGVVSYNTQQADEEGAGSEDEVLLTREAPPPSTGTTPPPPTTTTPPPTSTTPPPTTTTPPPTTTTPPPPPPTTTIDRAIDSAVTGNIPTGIKMPGLLALTWTNITDLDLHLTGPNADGPGRFHISFSEVGNFGAAPYFAALDNDNSAGAGAAGGELIGISQFAIPSTESSLYRVTVHNFTDSSIATSTGLSDPANNLRLRLFVDAEISRGAAGTAIVGGTVKADVTPRAGLTGNAWTAMTILPSRIGDPTGIVSVFSDTIDNRPVTDF